jgi:phosphoglycerate dehydrogenase-like enzyme
LAARSKNVSGAELSGQVGIIGFGHIGKSAAALFQGLGLDVVRATHGQQVDPKVPGLPLEELLDTSDIVVVALPATSSTENFVNQAMIKLMKPSAILLNYGRGGTVNEKAVAEAINNDRLAGAGFDVFAEEPIPSTHPFLNLSPDKRSKLILTAHIAGQTTDSKKRNFLIALGNVDRVARGENPLNELKPTGLL